MFGEYLNKYRLINEFLYNEFFQLHNFLFLSSRFLNLNKSQFLIFDFVSSVSFGLNFFIQEDSMINKIKKDCERKEEFLKTQTYPAYLSSPPKEINTNPKGIASLANTMPPPKPDPKTEEKGL